MFVIMIALNNLLQVVDSVHIRFHKFPVVASYTVCYIILEHFCLG